MTRRGAFAAALILGLLLRLAALPLPGTEDVGTWKIWAFGASRHVTHVYGVGGAPPIRGVVNWGSLETTVDYPPAAIYVLAMVGLAYRQIDPAFADGSIGLIEGFLNQIEFGSLGSQQLTRVLEQREVDRTLRHR